MSSPTRSARLTMVFPPWCGRCARAASHRHGAGPLPTSLRWWSPHTEWIVGSTRDPDRSHSNVHVGVYRATESGCTPARSRIVTDAGQTGGSTNMTDVFIVAEI